MPITLNNINEKVRTVEGTSRATPITMSNLDDRINALGDKGKWAIRTLADGTIPVDVRGWNWCVLDGRCRGRAGYGYIENNGQGVSFSTDTLNKISASWTVVNNKIQSSFGGSGTQYVTNIKVLFYTGTGY